MRQGTISRYIEDLEPSGAVRIYVPIELHEDAPEEMMQAEPLENMTMAEGPAQVKLSEAIERRMADFKEPREIAERQLVQTDEGLQLWELARKERIAAAERLP